MNAGRQFLMSANPILAGIIEKIDYPEEYRSNTVFHDLMACVIEQQIPYRSTKKTFEKLLTQANINQLSPDNFYQFERLALHETKLSESKFATIHRILEQWDSFPEDWISLTDDEVRKALQQIKGIGPWTIDMILMFTLNRPDIFPADDYHLKQLLPKMYNLDTSRQLKAQMNKVAENWSPYRSLAVRYLLEWKKVGG